SGSEYVATQNSAATARTSHVESHGFWPHCAVSAGCRRFSVNLTQKPAWNRENAVRRHPSRRPRQSAPCLPKPTCVRFDASDGTDPYWLASRGRIDPRRRPMKTRKFVHGAGGLAAAAATAPLAARLAQAQVPFSSGTEPPTLKA